MIARLIVSAFGSPWRLKRLCQQTKSPLLKKLLIRTYGFYQYENNSGIAWNSAFENIPCLPHGMKGVFISGDAKIGRNCVIFQQVTIGSNNLPDSDGKGAPTIGRNCYIGAGCKIIGNVRIGNNVRIGANTVVYKDVPDNSVVLSGEQRTIHKKAPLDNRYYSFRKRWMYFENGAWIPETDQKTLMKLQQRRSRFASDESHSTTPCAESA